MTTKFKRDGNTWSFTAAAAISSGDVVVQSGRVGVSHADYTTGDTAVMHRMGVFTLTKATSLAFAAGAVVYTTSSGVLTATKTSNEYLGHADAAATSGAGQTTVDVMVGDTPSVGEL